MEIVRKRGQRWGNRPIEGVGGAEAMVEDERCPGRGIVGWEVCVEDAAVRDGEVGHDQLGKKVYRQPSGAWDCGCVDSGFTPRRRTLRRGFGMTLCG